MPQPDTSAADASKPDTDTSDDNFEVTLKPEELEHAGIKTTPAVAVDYTAMVTGFGVVTNHELIAQAVADSAVADAALRQSQAALARMQRLAGTPGADSAEALESAQRQVANDAAGARLARNKASSVVGTQSPWRGDAGNRVLGSLASGSAQIVRATFPLGVWHGPDPRTLDVAPLDASPHDTPLRSHTVWPAPADPTLPGRSYFALFSKPAFREGDRVLVSAAAGAPEGNSGDTTRGVFIPASALLTTQGAYWCYVEHGGAGHFTRIPVDISKPRGDGYVVQQGVEAGDALVTAGAGLLLARETGLAAGGD